MTDNTRGGSNDAALPLIATDDVGGVQYQVVKLDVGADGTSDPVVGALPVDGSGVTQPVSGTVTAEQATAADLNATVVGTGTFAVQAALSAAVPAGNNNIGDVDVATIAAGDNNIGNVDIVSVPSPLSSAGHGTAAAALRVELPTDGTGVIATVGAVTAITNAVTVNSHAVTNAGVFATQIDGAALTALQLIDDAVYADEAAFTTATSKVSMAGVKAVTSGSAPDDAGGTDRAVSPISNRNRVPFIIGGDPGVITLKHTTITTAVTDAAIVTVAGGNKIVVTRISVTLDNASTVFPTLLIGFGAANTPTTTGVLIAHGGVPAGGGITVGDGSGILGIGADGEDLRVTTTGNATGNGLQIVVSYYLVVA